MPGSPESVEDEEEEEEGGDAAETGPLMDPAVCRLDPDRAELEGESDHHHRDAEFGRE